MSESTEPSRSSVRLDGPNHNDERVREVVTAERIAHGGDAVAHLQDGRVVFVDGALPGERVKVRLTESRERYARAVLDELPPEPSTDRVDPPCDHFGRWPERGRAPEVHCGGCSWQHASYSMQVATKRAVLVEALERIGKFDAPPVAPVVPCDPPWAYRNRLRVRLSGGRPALVAVDGKSLVPIDACPIAHPYVQSLVSVFESDLPDGTEVVFRAGATTGERLVLVDDREGRIDSADVELSASLVFQRSWGLEVAVGDENIHERIGDRLLRIPADAFFQVNTAMITPLVAAVRAALPPTVDRLVDLHSGVGLFAISLSDRANEVVAIEKHPGAVAAAVENAAGLDNLTLIEADATEGLAHVGSGIGALITDPPRGGLNAGVRRLLVDLRPDRIVYVSCDPAALARDGCVLCEAGYHLVACQPLDMFPQTPHVEAVATFQLPS